MTVKIVSVAYGGVLWVGSASRNTGKTFSAILGAAAGAVIAGGIICGVGGQALSSQQAEQVRKLIKKAAREYAQSSSRAALSQPHNIEGPAANQSVRAPDSYTLLSCYDRIAVHFYGAVLGR